MSSSSTASTFRPTSVWRWYDSAPVRIVALAAGLTAAPAYEAHRLLALADQDIWWRLRTGLWMLQSHAIPRTGIFSQAAARAWIDAGWGFDLLVAIAYRSFGLAGLPIFLMLLQIAAALALFQLAYLACGRFWHALILVAIAQYCIMPIQPRPGMCSLLLLAVELAILLEARRTGDERVLYCLPALFALWVNLDRQFTYGLMVLALFCLAAIVEALVRGRRSVWIDLPLPAVRLGTVGVIAAACLLATFVSPYTWRLHGLLWNSVTSSTADRYFRELHSMRFRQPRDYLLMLLAMAAFFALGRRRSRDLFLFSLLVVSTVISFRMMRDNWLVVVVAVALIGNALATGEAVKESSRNSGQLRLIALGVSAVVIISTAVLAANLPSRTSLMSAVSDTFPVAAGDYIKKNHLSGPLFNAYPWGGFLTWYLPEYPVSIDGRTDLYGDGYDAEYFRLMQAEVPLESDPSFAQAQTILLESNSPLAQALSTLADFSVAYRDRIAIVLVRNR